VRSQRVVNKADYLLNLVREYRNLRHRGRRTHHHPRDGLKPGGGGRGPACDMVKGLAEESGVGGAPLPDSPLLVSCDPTS